MYKNIVMFGVPSFSECSCTLDQEMGALETGLIVAWLGGKDSTMSISSFKTLMKCLQSKMSLKSLNKRAGNY